MSVIRSQPILTDSQSWLGAVDVGYLTEEERDAILEVLQRDENIKRREQNRISKLKSSLRDVRRKGAKRAENTYSVRVCARCNNKTGIFFNSSTQCPVCNHKVCRQCMTSGTFSRNSICVVCYQEAKLKAETGEWFYGIMRPELRSMLDGPTLVKQAVVTKPVHFDQRMSPSRATPVIIRTSASSKSISSSHKDTTSLNSFDTGDTGSSTESHKQRNKQNKYGPAETGSIDSLRKSHTVQRTLSGDINDGPSPVQKRRAHTLPGAVPLTGPPKPARTTEIAAIALAKKQQSQTEPPRQLVTGLEDIDTGPFLLQPDAQRRREHSDLLYEDRYSEHGSISSAESKSIDGVFEDYIRQREEQKHSSTINEQVRREGLSHDQLSSREAENWSPSSDEDRAQYSNETADQIAQLPEPRVSTLPRRLNDKLLQQKKLSVSVPALNVPRNDKRSKAGTIDTHGGYDRESMDYSMNRDMSASVPDLSKSVTSLNSMGGHHDLPVTGEIKFSLIYKFKINVLFVNVVECRNLAVADRRRKYSNPYVKCYILPDRKNKQKTEVKKRTVNPKYNKRLKFSVGDKLSTRMLELSVWHAGTFTRNLFLGQVLLPLDTWEFDSTQEHWYPLRQRETIKADFVRETMYKGDLIVGLKYTSPGLMTPGKHKPTFGELNILIKEAKNLTPVRSNGTSDPYVKIMLLPDKQFRQKTSVIQKSTSPEWNYNIRMQLYQPVEESGLQLTIWHRDKLQGSTLLGGCRLNLGQAHSDQKWMDAAGTEKSLWQSAISSPGQWVDGSLELRPSM